MSIEKLQNALPDFAKDIRLNLSSVLKEESASGLHQKQIYLIALATAYALKSDLITISILQEENQNLSPMDKQAAKAAATIMAMNNVYYRFVHLTNDKSFATLPAKLRMNIIANPGIDKADFELMCLAVSAINGCGMCIDAHTNTLINAGISKIDIQSVVRIAAVLNATATALTVVN